VKTDCTSVDKEKCMTGQGCIQVTTSANFDDIVKNVSKILKTDPISHKADNRRTFLFNAFFANDDSRIIFYDPSTFGMYLTKNVKGLHMKSQNIYGLKCMQSQEAEFRDFQSVLMNQGCQYDIIMGDNGMLYRRDTGETEKKEVAGTWWRDAVGHEVVKFINCKEGTNQFWQSGEKINSVDVEHIREKRDCPDLQKDSAADFVVAWSAWNQRNGQLSERVLIYGEKEIIYGKNILGCANILMDKKCNNEAWDDKLCKDAIDDIGNMITNHFSPEKKKAIYDRVKINVYRGGTSANRVFSTDETDDGPYIVSQWFQKNLANL
jgi:hypothetical protein